MELDMMFFQELFFTVALSVMIYLIFCKFNSYVSQERDKITGLCCVDACEEAVLLCEENLEFKEFVRDRRVGCVKEEVVEVDTNDSMVDQREVEDDEGVVGGDDETADKVFVESPMRRKLQEIELEHPLEDDFPEIQIKLREIEGSSKVEEGDEGLEEKEDIEKGLFDDWEGIERTDLEKDFGTAVVFVDSKVNANGLDNDVKMQLYGLHKVATDGPCCTPQPMALKLSARAKWNAWQKVGDISQEEAMEQYIALLSRSITDWKDEH